MPKNKAEIMRKIRKDRKNSGFISYRRYIKPEHVLPMDKYKEMLENGKSNDRISDDT